MEKSSSSNRKLGAGSDKALVFSGALLFAFIGIIIFFRQPPAKKIPAQLPNPMSITDPDFGPSAAIEEERRFEKIEGVAQAARETAQKFAPENPPLFWQAERVVFHPDSVWMILLRLSPQGRDLSVGLVIHKSHEYYSDWLEFAGTAAARDDNPLTTRLFYVGLVDPAHPESPVAYLSPLFSYPPPP